MSHIQLFATPWWVNLFILAPFVAYYFWRKDGLAISRSTLLTVGIFGIAFGFVEASVVIYIRAAIGMLPGFDGSVADIIRHSSDTYQQIQSLSQLPKSVLQIEFYREAATIIMLTCIGLVGAKSARERFALFLWAFAAWDIFYYVGLWAVVRWPTSLLSPDVLFLIPVPWFAQVWFPILVSGLTMFVIAWVRVDKRRLRSSNSL